MNKVILVGRLTKDPELNQTANSQYVRFNVAVDRRFKKDDQPDADFPSCVAWAKTAEFINKYFHKGMKIGVEGRIQTGKYDDKNGVTHYTTDVFVENAEFVESKKASQGGGGSTPPPAEPKVDENGFMDVTDDEADALPFA